MLDIKDTVALLIWEVNPCNSSFGNLLVKLYILLVNLRASFQTGKSSNDLIVDKYLNLRFINLPICLSPNQPIENKIKGKCTIGQLKAIGQSTNQYRKQNQKIFCLSQWLNVQDVNLEILYCIRVRKARLRINLPICRSANRPIKIKNKNKKQSKKTYR